MEHAGEDAMGRVIGLAVLVAALVLGACSGGADAGGATTSTSAPNIPSTTQPQGSTTSSVSPEAAISTTRILLVGNSITSTGGVWVPVDSGCDTVTLVATYTDLASDTRTAGWQAVLAGDANLLANPGFESGSTGGWGIFEGDGFPGDTLFAMTNPFGIATVRTGSYAAQLTSGEGSNRTTPAGYDQVIQVTPGESYSGFVWFAEPETRIGASPPRTS
ncbi:MAG: hypothetical protein M3132_14540 [Actinomycetia bacterium]|nr:hypothetical protein [Actinomycetes bacterium]